ARGRARIERVLFEHAGHLPETAPWRICVGPLGTGNNLVKDVDIWQRLEQTQRHLAGLDMEGSAIGFTAHVQRVPFAIVVKGVMDCGDRARAGGFRAFGGGGAAEVLLGSLRTHLEPKRPPAASVILRSKTAKPPAAANPGTLLNAWYQVVPFFEESRR